MDEKGNRFCKNNSWHQKSSFHSSHLSNQFSQSIDGNNGAKGFGCIDFKEGSWDDEIWFYL